MKIVRFFMLAVFFIFSLALNVSAEEKLAENLKDETLVNLHSCEDIKLGVKFLCDPAWELKTDTDMFMIILSNDPSVTFTVSKVKTDLKTIEGLTRPVLQEMGGYADFFQRQIVQVAGHDAIEVVSNPVGHDDVQLWDYYVISKGDLYGFLFFVQPKESLGQYQELFKEIKESISFL